MVLNGKSDNIYNLIKLECGTGYGWPDRLKKHLCDLRSGDGLFDPHELESILLSFDKRKDVIVSFLTNEYIQVGKLWLSMIHNLKISQLLIVAGDRQTGETLDQLGVPNLKVRFSDDSVGEMNPTGFSDKGLKIGSLKFPVMREIISHGFSAMLTDIDALILSSGWEVDMASFDVAFQRILSFPKPIAAHWGFAACGGFIWFSSSKKNLILLDRAMSIMQEIYDDQVAINLALFEEDISWTVDGSSDIFQDDLLRKAEFSNHAASHIDGVGLKRGIKVRALAPEIYWRHDFIPLELDKVKVFHPNSPKTELGKLETFSSYDIN